MTNNQTNWQELCAQLFEALRAHGTTWSDDVLLDRVWVALRAASRRAQSSPAGANSTFEPMTEPRLVLLLAWKIAEILSKSRPGDDCTPFAKDVILEVAAWLRKRNVRARASVEIAGDLEREIKQAPPEPEGLTDEALLPSAVPTPDCSEDYWRRDALEQLLRAATRYKLGVYSVGELKIFEDRARAVLARWGK